MEILIVCGGGASSSFIAQNVYKAGKAQGMELNVEAISETELEDYVYGKDAILIGPHLKYLEENIKEIIEPEGVPFAFISDMNYAKMDGAAASTSFTGKKQSSDWSLPAFADRPLPARSQSWT